MARRPPELRFSTAESLANWLNVTVNGQAILSAAIPVWLQSTPDGIEMLDEAAMQRTSIAEDLIRAEVDRRLARRASCLIVCHADGKIEAFGNEVIVHFADMLDVDGAEETTEAEAYMEANLPLKFRRLVMQRSAIHYPDHRTPDQERQRLFELQCFRYLPRLKDQEAERLRKEADRRGKLARENIARRDVGAELAPF